MTKIIILVAVLLLCCFVFFLVSSSSDPSGELAECQLSPPEPEEMELVAKPVEESASSDPPGEPEECQLPWPEFEEMALLTEPIDQSAGETIETDSEWKETLKPQEIQPPDDQSSFPLEFDWGVIDEKFRSENSTEIERPIIDGADFTKRLQDGKKPEIEEWSILSFQKGRFDLSRLFRDGYFSRFPPNITFKGEGIDKTLLMFGKGFSGCHNIERLRFCDLTIDAANEPLFNIRAQRISLDFERIRVVRFDSGCAGSSLFKIDSVYGGVVVRAMESEFICGYGDGSRAGTLCRREQFLGSFSNCIFVLMDFCLEDHHWRNGKGWQILFDRCHFTLMYEGDVFNNTTVELFKERFVKYPFSKKNVVAIFQDCVLDPEKPLLRQGETIRTYREDFNFEEFLSRFSERK